MLSTKPYNDQAQRASPPTASRRLRGWGVWLLQAGVERVDKLRCPRGYPWIAPAAAPTSR